MPLICLLNLPLFQSSKRVLFDDSVRTWGVLELMWLDAIDQGEVEVIRRPASTLLYPLFPKRCSITAETPLAGLNICLERTSGLSGKWSTGGLHVAVQYRMLTADGD